jgi:alginate O-acetyltransferase complex protein AlgI
VFFTSLTFLLFFVGIFTCYWGFLSNSRTSRNLFLLFSSYLFYGWWDWRFLGFIILSSALDYTIGLRLDTQKGARARRFLLWVSILVNLGLLGAFKYFDFFSRSLAEGFAQFGITADPLLLRWVLPVGISFYTFQTLSYSIDVYRGHMRPTRDPIAFFAFVAFFPQLVAGPIERAQRLLPQFERKRIAFDSAAAVDGLRMILWGLFLKALIADNLAHQVDGIFADPTAQPGSVLALGAVYFGFQIYGDFAGYSLIARGTARLLGFALMVNFRVPYFSRDIGEFWRRWHISLSTWFRDYVYIPLGGNRGGAWWALRNVMIVFLISGLWHGAEWTFIVWGALHGLAFAPLFLLRLHHRNEGEIAPGRWLPVLRDLPGTTLTFAVVSIGWIFFRAENLGHAGQYLSALFEPSLFSIPLTHRGGLVWIALLLVLDWIHRNDDVPIRWPILSVHLRWAGYLLLCVLVFYRGYFGEQEFIYFQF